MYFEVVARCEVLTPEPEVETQRGRRHASGDQCRGLMVEVVEAGIADGSIRADVGDPKVVSTVLWGFMHGVLQLAATKANVVAHEGVNIKELVDQALLMATRSVEART